MPNFHVKVAKRHTDFYEITSFKLLSVFNNVHPLNNPRFAWRKSPPTPRPSSGHKVPLE
ncbi:hypothetical protein Hanom_Chr16g01452041 [Helianthus anomalus]